MSLTHDRLDELKWRFVAAASAGIARVSRDIAPTDRVVVVVVMGPEPVGQVVLADATNVRHMMLEVPPGEEPHLWCACEFCARRATHRAEDGAIVCRRCGATDQLTPLELISV